MAEELRRITFNNPALSLSEKEANLKFRLENTRIVLFEKYKLKTFNVNFNIKNMFSDVLLEVINDARIFIEQLNNHIHDNTNR